MKQYMVRIALHVLLPVCSLDSNGRTSGVYRNADLRQNASFSQILPAYVRTLPSGRRTVNDVQHRRNVWQWRVDWRARSHVEASTEHHDMTVFTVDGTQYLSLENLLEERAGRIVEVE